MDFQNSSSECRWHGCRANVVAGNVFCLDHHRQLHHNGPSQVEKERSFLGSQTKPLLDPTRDPTATRLKNGVTGNSSLNKPPPSRTPLPAKEKKQLPDKHTARKSVKQPPISGQPYGISPTSPVRGLSIDASSTHPRPAKKQRLSGPPNSGSYSKSDDSSYPENGIPHPSKRGMFRQPEERTHGLSAVDDFALRPKKRETTTVGAKSRAHSDQQQPRQEESHFSGSIHQPPPLNKPPQSTGLDGTMHPKSLVIDLTEDDEPEFTSSGSRHRLPPKNHTSNGISVGSHKSQDTADSGSGLKHEQKHPVASNDQQQCNGPTLPLPLPQPRLNGGSQAQHTQTIEQRSNVHPQKPPDTENIRTSPMQAVPTLAKETTVETRSNKQVQHSSPLENGLGPLLNGAPTGRRHDNHVPPTNETQVAGQLSPCLSNEKSAGPLELVLSTAGTKQTTPKQTTKPMEIVDPIPMTPKAPRVRTPRVASPDQSNGAQPPVESIEPALVTPMDEVQPIAMNSQGPLSSLLGGREWKKMAPEERRLFWVSQHDPEKFDAQIYSDINRPFRPGDALFGVTDDALTLQPKRPATHFDYIDPRTHWSETWYPHKRKEDPAQQNRKADLGNAIERAVQRKRAAPQPDQKQKLDSLPQRVRNNPKWLASLSILDQIAAQTRERDALSKPQPESAAQDTASAAQDTTSTPVIYEVDSDVDMEST
ncbi:hypothetical protein F4777DRAFT_502142 [Nemania sp. FL0916]|nr:hypothetical protein F4777DRAFT_502142 [Nemania sp. FL0916]